MPTGGAATMNTGENLLYLARKEQCLALGTQLRTKFKINDYKIYRITPNGDVTFLHPADGVFPEKVNEGRTAVGSVPRNIGSNPEPATLKFSGKKSYDA
jgi:photosystem I subunit 2